MARRCSRSRKSRSPSVAVAGDARSEAMADPMRIRAEAKGDKAVVRVLMSHEMETGQRRDTAGKVVPAWFIQEVSATHNGAPVFSALWGPAVSKNPFVLFTIKGA